MPKDYVVCDREKDYYTWWSVIIKVKYLLESLTFQLKSYKWSYFVERIFNISPLNKVFQLKSLIVVLVMLYFVFGHKMK